MTNPILMVTNAGHGVTPDCPEAKFSKGDVVRVRRHLALAHWPHELVVLAVVPPGFPAAYALADLVGRPRPLMISEPRRVVSYILCEEHGDKAYCATERLLLRSGKPSLEIGSVRVEGDAA